MTELLPYPLDVLCFCKFNAGKPNIDVSSLIVPLSDNTHFAFFEVHIITKPNGFTNKMDLANLIDD